MVYFLEVLLNTLHGTGSSDSTFFPPTGAMSAHYDIFRHHIVKEFPAYGHALWEPGHGNLYPAVKVGDVGYIRRGKFRRLFNVLLPAEDESHERFGVPEYHEPLNVTEHIETGMLSPMNFCSAKVTSMPESEHQVNG